jgi:hypothetical protein
LALQFSAEKSFFRTLLGSGRCSEMKLWASEKIVLTSGYNFQIKTQIKTNTNPAIAQRRPNISVVRRQIHVSMMLATSGSSVVESLPLCLEDKPGFSSGVVRLLPGDCAASAGADSSGFPVTAKILHLITS